MRVVCTLVRSPADERTRARQRIREIESRSSYLRAHGDDLGADLLEERAERQREQLERHGVTRVVDSWA